MITRWQLVKKGANDSDRGGGMKGQTGTFRPRLSAGAVLGMAGGDAGLDAWHAYWSQAPGGLSLADLTGVFQAWEQTQIIVHRFIAGIHDFQ